MITSNNKMYKNIQSNTMWKVNNWKQSKCPSIPELKNKLWYVHTMEYQTAIRWIRFAIWNTMEKFINTEWTKELKHKVGHIVWIHYKWLTTSKLHEWYCKDRNSFEDIRHLLGSWYYLNFWLRFWIYQHTYNKRYSEMFSLCENLFR